jgi:succinoglycan biosynthesis transport protein ExoP
MSKNFELLRQAGKERQSLDYQPHGIPLNAAAVSTREPVQVLRESNVEWQRAWHTLLRHWRLSAYFAGGVMIAVVAVTLFSKPVYEPVARLEIDPPGAELFSLEGRSTDGNDAEYIETQVRNLKSDVLAIAIIRNLHLEKNPEFARRGIVSRMLAAIRSSKSSNSQQTKSSGTQPLTLTANESLALARFQQNLKIRRDSASRSVSIAFADHDPVLAATITNTVASTFIDRMYQAHHAAIMQSTEWLARQLDDIRAKTDESNRALADFQRASGIADLERDRSTVSEEMTELSRQKTLANAERMQFESFLQKLRKGSAETLPQVQTNPVVQQLSQRLAEARTELSQASAVYGTSHPNVKKLQNGVDELQVQLQLQRNLIVSQMEMSYSAALTRERLVDAEMAGATKKLGSVAEYNNLKKQAQANTDLYNSLYARVKEAGIAAASKSSNIRLVEEARVLDSPTRPNPLKNLGFGLLAALVGGALLAFIRESVDTRVHDIDDVRQCTGISSVAVLPLAPRGNGIGLFGFNRQVSQFDKPMRFLLHTPQSIQAEAMRSLHTTLMLSQPDRPPQVVLVASSLPGEGKTTVAVNLASALAQQGHTCLIDADLRRPAIAHVFNLSGGVGLREYLSGSASLESITFAVDQVPNLAVIPAGEAVKESGALFGIEKIKAAIRQLRTEFQFVVVDSPPILAYSDGRALSAIVDGIVFVGRANLVTREALARSMDLLAEVRSAPVIEIVLNGADPNIQTYNYSYASSYYRGA